MSKIDTLEPEFKEKVLEYMDALKPFGINCVVTSGRRTIAEQNALYEQGRTTPGEIVTKAKGGQSPHNFGLAADLCPINPATGKEWWNAPDDVWHAMHNIAENQGVLDLDRIKDALDSGYDWKFKDSPHVEDPNWKVTQHLWAEGKIDVD